MVVVWCCVSAVPTLHWTGWKCVFSAVQFTGNGTDDLHLYVFACTDIFLYCSCIDVNYVIT